METRWKVFLLGLQPPGRFRDSKKAICKCCPKPHICCPGSCKQTYHLGGGGFVVGGAGSSSLITSTRSNSSRRRVGTRRQERVVLFFRNKSLFSGVTSDRKNVRNIGTEYEEG